MSYHISLSKVGKSSGHLNHLGGSVCPEHISNGWQISQQVGMLVFGGLIVNKLTTPPPLALPLPKVTIQNTENKKQSFKMVKQDSSGNWGWMADTGVKVLCVEEPLGDKVPPGHFHMAHNPQVLIVFNTHHHKCSVCIIVIIRWKRGGWRQRLIICT